jgi:proteasome accessory factor B
METRRRLPTYGAATRLARIVYGLYSRPFGWSLRAIQDELDISERTLHRYLAASRKMLVGEGGQPILNVVTHGGRRVLHLADGASAQDATTYQLLLMYFALSAFRSLDGTVIKDGVDGLWERLRRGLPQPQQMHLAAFVRKFYTVPYAAKDYRGMDHLLDPIIQCLVHQRRMRTAYRGRVGEGKVHEFDPYTLVMYRAGLYLIGYSHLFRRIIWLAVERIRRVEKLDAKFAYPKTYSPQKYTQGMFGIIAGPPTRVELLLRNDETLAFLSSRQIHPTQKFVRRRDGATVLSMTVRGTTELASWILSLGPWVEVLRPPALRAEVRSLLTTAAALYGSEAE